MNAAARALSQGSQTQFAGRFLVLSGSALGMILLIVALLGSALAVVYVKALNRQLFSELQTVQQTRDSLNVRLGQLLLEQNTLAAPARVQTIAQRELGMVVPAAKDVAIVSVASMGAAPVSHG